MKNSWQVVQTVGVPPNQGNRKRPSSGWTAKSRKAERKMVMANSGIDDLAGSIRAQDWARRSNQPQMVPTIAAAAAGRVEVSYHSAGVWTPPPVP